MELSSSIAVVLVALFAASTVSSLTGAGFGSVILIAQSFFFDIRTNAATTAIYLFLVLLSKTVAFRSSANWRIVLWYCLLGLPATYAGGLLLFRIPPRIPEIGLGALCIGFVVLHNIRLLPRISRHPLVLTVLGALNGFVGGMVGNNGIIMTPIMACMSLTKAQLVATTAVAGLILEAGKVAAYLPQLEANRALLITIGLSVPTIACGVIFGKWLLKRVSQNLFEKLLSGVIFLGGLRLLIG